MSLGGGASLALSILAADCQACGRLVVSTLPKRPDRTGLEQLVGFIALIQLSGRPLCLHCAEEYCAKYGWNEFEKVRYYGVRIVAEALGTLAPMPDPVLGLLFGLLCGKIGEAAQKSVVNESVQLAAAEYKRRGLSPVDESDVEEAYAAMRQQGIL